MSLQLGKTDIKSWATLYRDKSWEPKQFNDNHIRWEALVEWSCECEGGRAVFALFQLFYIEENRNWSSGTARYNVVAGDLPVRQSRDSANSGRMPRAGVVATRAYTCSTSVVFQWMNKCRGSSRADAPTDNTAWIPINRSSRVDSRWLAPCRAKTIQGNPFLIENSMSRCERPPGWQEPRYVPRYWRRWTLRHFESSRTCTEFWLLRIWFGASNSWKFGIFDLSWVSEVLKVLEVLIRLKVLMSP